MTLKSSLFILLVFLVPGCATGPKYMDVQSSIPAIESGEGRIYFYRLASMFGAGVRPTVDVNGENVGDATPGGFFFVDRAPGDYEVVITAERHEKLKFHLDQGEEKYVRMTVRLEGIQYRVYPELVAREKALEEMQGLSYIGSPVK